MATSNTTRMEDGGGDLRSTIKKWNIIYPVYLNSKKTVAEGRRIAAAKACPDPTCIEIADCCSHLKIPHAIELDKAYPRDFFQVGRVRVQLKKDDGSPVNPAIKTKKAADCISSSSGISFLLFRNWVSLFLLFCVAAPCDDDAFALTCTPSVCCSGSALGTIPVIDSFSSSSRTLVMGFSTVTLSCSPSSV